MKKAKMRVAVYCRVSTKMELQEGSFEQQMTYYRELLSHHPQLELVDVYGDKGKTGRNTNRPGFQQMLKDCRAKRIDMILTKSVSRFARNVADCVETVRELQALDIPVIFEKEGINTMEKQGEFLLSMMAAIAQEESNSISQNILWANNEHNASGKPHFRPSYGYAKARRKWEWHIVEGEAKRVRVAFFQASAGRKYEEIRTALNQIEEEEQTGMIWSMKRLKYLLSNVNYTGDCLTNKFVRQGKGRGQKQNRGTQTQYYILGHHEPLVSREMFEQVQANMEEGRLNQRKVCRARKKKGEQ